MAATKYTYTISTAFPNAKVDPSSLTEEIDDSSIATTLEYINTDEATDDCDIWFADALSGGDQTTLDGLVAAHTGVPALPLPLTAPGWNLKIEDRDLTDPPGSPTVGLYYIVAATATGAWAGKENLIASWNGTTWQFQRGSIGFAVWVADEKVVVVYENDTDKWQPYGVPSADANFGTDLNMAESTATSVTTSTSWQAKVTLNTTTLTGGTYVLLVSYGWSGDTTMYDFEARVRQGETVLGQPHVQEPKDASGINGATGTNQRHYATRHYVLSLSAQSYTFDLQYRTSFAGNESSVWDAYLTLWRVS